MNSMNYQRRVSNIQILEENLRCLQKETNVKKPYKTIKSLFYNKLPKNRKNLKNLETRKVNASQICYNNKSKIKLASIESIIKNSKDQEFLSSDNPNNNIKPIIIIPIQNYVNQNSSSTLDSVKTNHNGISNVLKKNMDNISNHSRNKQLNNSLNDVQILTSKKISKMSNNTFHKKTEEKNLNDLYNEFLENVRKHFYNLIKI